MILLGNVLLPIPCGLHVVSLSQADLCYHIQAIYIKLLSLIRSKYKMSNSFRETFPF